MTKTKKFLDYIAEIKNDHRNNVKPEFRKYFDELTSLYLERKLENRRTLENAITALKKNKEDSVLTTLDKYRNKPSVKGSIKSSKSLENNEKSIQYKNRKQKQISDYIDEIKYLNRNKIKPEFKKYFDELTSLYVDRKLENKRTLQNAISLLRRNKEDSALQILYKHRNKLTVQGAIKGSKDKEFHLTANIHRTIQYKPKNRSKNYKVDLANPQKNYTETQATNVTKGKKLVYSLKIKAQSVEQAKQIFLEMLNNDFNDESYSYVGKIDDVEFVSALDESKLTKTKTQHMYLRSVLPLKYDFVKEEEKFLQKVNEECVIDNFLGVYEPLIKNLTRESLLQDIEKYFNPCSALDAGISTSKSWTIQDGVTPSCIETICKKYDISHYAYDILSQCFMKHISKSKNYPALCYYAINNHMYLIKDKDLVKSLVEKSKAKDINNVNLNENLYEKKSIFVDANIHENIDPKNLTKLQDDTNIVIYSRSSFNSINDILADCIKIYGIPSKIKSNRSQIQQFQYTIKDKKYILCNDPNNVHETNWKEIQALCIKHKVEFSNQTFTKFCSELKEIFDTPVRKVFNDDEKLEILKMYNNQCNICSNIINENTKYNIDHIRPLSNGGSDANQLDNIQALCLTCHKDKTLLEQSDGAFNKIDDAVSTYNANVNEIMEKVKAYAFVETLNEPVINENDTLFTFDINKCRKYILYDGEYDYPVFTVMDNVAKYNNETCPGIYYIETNNYFPMRGTTWYYYNEVDFALKTELIAQNDIKYVVKSSLSIPAKYYNKWIDHVYATMDEAKAAINTMIGSFNYNCTKHENWKSLCITESSFESMHHFIEKDAHFIDVMMIDGKSYFHLFEKSETKKLDSKSNIYNQIVQQENIELYKLSKIIESKGGRILDLNTDAITCTFPDNKNPFVVMEDGTNIEGYYYKDKTPKYKLENGHRVKSEKMKNFVFNTPEPILRSNLYTEFKDVENNDFSSLVKQMIDLNKSFTLQGCPGVGKSHFTRQIQEELTKLNLKFVSLAPTNKAALIIHGQTLNKFQTKIKTTKKFDHLDLDYIIVDEISMMKEKYYAFLQTIKAHKRNIKFILVGDFNQLMPVNDRVDCNYKNSKILHELSSGNRLTLTKCRRSDDALFKTLQFDNIPNIQRDDFTHNETKINICFTNEKRMEVNDKYMMKEKSDNDIVLPKVAADPNSQKVYLKKGMPIIATKTLSFKDDVKSEEEVKLLSTLENNKLKVKEKKAILGLLKKLKKQRKEKKSSIINNKQYTLFDIDNKNQMVHIRSKDAQEIASKKKVAYDGPNIHVKFDLFQRYFYPAYCITTHKMQGETIKKPYTIHEFDRMDQRLKYVALTRGTCKENINII
jgi:5-methylcytosine-specific restriction endonuclease McrA